MQSRLIPWFLISGLFVQLPFILLVLFPRKMTSLPEFRFIL